MISASLKPITFKNGAADITIPRGQVAYTNPIDFKVGHQTMITVTLYFKAGQSGSSITGHPGSRTTSHMATGNKINEATISGANTKHWYFISGVEAWAPANTSAFIILGDSITDGRGSTDDANNRYVHPQSQTVLDIKLINMSSWPFNSFHSECLPS